MWLFKLTAFATNAATTTADKTTEIIIFLPLMGNLFPLFINMLSFNYECKVRQKQNIQQKKQTINLGIYLLISLYQVDWRKSKKYHLLFSII